MGRKPAAKQGDTLKDIRSAAFGLFGQHGYDGVSMNALASEADITKAALYWHYESKEALFTDCLRELHALFQHYVFERVKAEENPGDKLLAVFHGIVALMRDERIKAGIAGYWLNPGSGVLDEASALQRDFEEQSARFIASIIQEGIDEGELVVEIPVEEMALAIISTMEAITLPLRRLSPDEILPLVGSLAHTFFRAHATGDELPKRAMELANFQTR
ncbi:MAG: TetR/AcrR family transcriptional regulator [Salinisphaeraceae bacterium]|nr:TetR/AcrR family transcriptional regulator [Salinisphaeraceae bacterium]